MFDKIIQFSVKRKLFVGFTTLGLPVLLFILPLQVQAQQTITLDEVITMAKKIIPALNPQPQQLNVAVLPKANRGSWEQPLSIIHGGSSTEPTGTTASSMFPSL